MPGIDQIVRPSRMLVERQKSAYGVGGSILWLVDINRYTRSKVVSPTSMPWGVVDDASTPSVHRPDQKVTYTQSRQSPTQRWCQMPSTDRAS